MIDEGKKDQLISQSAQLLAAFSGSPQAVGTGRELAKKWADLYRDSGTPEGIEQAKALENLAVMDPRAARLMLGIGVNSMGKKGEAAFDAYLGSQKGEREERKNVADIAQSQAAAGLSWEKTATERQVRPFEIEKISSQIDLAKARAEYNRIAALNSNIARETDQLKKEDLIVKRDEAIRTKAADLESARANMDNMLNTADRILATPMSVIGSAAGPVSSRLPTLTQDTADFEALVENLGSQAFLAQIPNIKGMGALSNAEGDKLQSALQNFSLKQSPERLVKNVNEAQRLILKARNTLAKRYGVKENIPDTPAAAPPPADINALLKKYGVQ